MTGDIKIIVLLINHRTQIMQCGQVFHMQRIDHHALVQSYLDTFRSWQKNKNYNTELDIKTHTNPFHYCRAGIKDTINSCNVKMIQTRHQNLPCTFSPLESTLSRQAIQDGKLKRMEDNEADLLCCALLQGISFFDST